MGTHSTPLVPPTPSTMKRGRQPSPAGPRKRSKRSSNVAADIVEAGNEESVEQTEGGEEIDWYSDTPFNTRETGPITKEECSHMGDGTFFSVRISVLRLNSFAH